MSSPENSGAPGANAYASDTPDHHGLVAGLVDELGLVEKIDAMIPQDLSQRQVSVGMAVQAMILTGLGFVQRKRSLPPWERGHPVRILGLRPSWPKSGRDARAPRGLNVYRAAGLVPDAGFFPGPAGGAAAGAGHHRREAERRRAGPRSGRDLRVRGGGVLFPAGVRRGEASGAVRRGRPPWTRPASMSTASTTAATSRRRAPA
jgi:hypothetical protein